MVPKKTLMISAALTAFVLVILAGVTTAFKQQPALESPVPVVETQAPAQAPDLAPAPTQVPFISPQEAAQAAASFMGRDDLYSVESSTWNNAPAYMVTFSSGDIVYVSMDGQILATVSPTPVVVPASGGRHGGGNGGGEHEEEHEKEHEGGED